MPKLTGLAALVVAVATGPAFARTGGHVMDGASAGFPHPFTGLDHMAAMICAPRTLSEG